MAGVVVLCIALCGLFLQQYYISNKTKLLKDVYRNTLMNGNISEYSTDTFEESMRHLSHDSNISLLIVGSDSEIVYSSADRMGMDRIMMHLFGFLLDKEGEPASDRTIEVADSYVIRRSYGMDGGNLEMVGRLNNNDSFILYTPLESIQESTNYAIRFFAMIGCIGTVIGGIIIYCVTRSVTKPILQLSEISKRMVDLDFDARYTGKKMDEIGLLGDNMNLLSESLEHSISDLKTANLELQRDIEKKEKLDEMRRDFIAGISHELKTPIALISGYAEGLKEGISDDPESRDFYLDVILDEASKMDRMVKNLLILNQLESGDEMITLERFDIAELIDGFLLGARFLPDQDEISVSFEHEGPVYVWGDEFRAEQVFTNFYSNAVHYCKETASGEKYIRILTALRGDVQRISIFNTGDPIPEESLERLWDKFYKVDKARSRAYGGSGVGLSIVKAIQDSLHQGYGVINHDNGVEFWFELSAK
ncbi:MAG: HAMP domain-containing histidine kinase [Lachnospiraceae bacterium]|nr:HAMP domain-containing histidine kinase [Lachnospiraceae bacterium]